MSGFRIFGIAVAVFGVVATIFPQWFAFITKAAEPTPDLYEQVERHVRGGMVFSVGLMFMAITSLRPWSVSIPSVIFYFVTGALVARVYGVIVVGAVPKQWMWMGVEAVLMAVAAFWLWRSTPPA